MTFRDALDAADKLTKIAALVVGGIWAYVKFFKGRTFQPRVEPSITAAVRHQDGVPYLIVTAAVKNIGLTTFAFAQDGLCVLLFGANVANAPKAQRVVWRELATLPVLQHHRWIEPGETADDQVLIELPAASCAILRVELRFLSREKSWKLTRMFPWLKRRRVSWSQSAIVVKEPHDV